MDRPLIAQLGGDDPFEPYVSFRPCQEVVHVHAHALTNAHPLTHTCQIDRMVRGYTRPVSDIDVVPDGEHGVGIMCSRYHVKGIGPEKVPCGM